MELLARRFSFNLFKNDIITTQYNIKIIKYNFMLSFKLNTNFYIRVKFVVSYDSSIYLQKTILSLHNDLMIAGENLESLYSWSLLLWLSNLCLHIVSNIYFIIKWMIVKHRDVEAWPLVSCLSCWLLAFFFQLLLLHIACDFASSQVKLSCRCEVKYSLALR